LAQVNVAVYGALGKMGSTVLSAVNENAETIPVAGVDVAAVKDSVLISGSKNSVPLFPTIESMLKTTRPDVVVDFSNAEGALDVFGKCIAEGIKVVSGSTGLTRKDLDHISSLSAKHKTGVISAPNFAIGAVLLTYLAGVASRYFDYGDLIESHHEGKVDSPSGTALSIADSMASGHGSRFDQNMSQKEILKGTRGGDFEGINVHSVRMPGRVARHEVVFGGLGQTLTMIHDSLNRESFMPGVIAAVKYVLELNYCVVGLEKVLGLDKIRR